MGKLLKILFSLLLTLVLLIGIAAVVAPMLIDPNDVKLQLSEAGSKATGREFELQGDLSLSVFPWLGFEVGRLRLGNAEGFDNGDFAVIEEAMVKVKLMPLLSKRIEVSEVVLRGMQLQLARNAQGVGNWEDLAKSSAKQESSSVVKVEPKVVQETPVQDEAAAGQEQAFKIDLAAVSIGGVVVENARVAWNDASSGQQVEISDLDLSTDRIRFDYPIGFKLDMVLESASEGLTEELGMTGQVTVNQRLDHFLVDGLKLASMTRGAKIPNGELETRLETALDVDLGKQRLSVTGLTLTAADEFVLGADLIGTSIIDAPVITGPVTITDFSPRKLMEKLQLALPETSDPEVLGRSSVKLNLRADQNSAALSDMQLRLDDTSVTGTLKVNDFKTQAVVFDFDVDAINVDRYLPPKKGEDEGGSKVSGSSAPAAGAGNGSGKQVAAAGGAASKGSDEIALPMEALRQLNVQGAVDIGRLQAAGVKMAGVRFKINGKNGVIKTDQMIESFYQGKLEGAVNLDARNSKPAFDISEKLSAVELGPLLKDLQGEDKLTGRADITTSLRSSGNTVAAIKSGLNGSINADIADGVLNGFNLVKFVREAKTKFDGTTFEGEALENKTAFETLQYVASINQGVVTSKSIVAKAPGMDVSGKGTASLVTEELDHKITVTMTGSLADSTGVKIKELESLRGVPLVIKVDGSFSKPSANLDLSAMLKEKQKQVIEEKKDELKEKVEEKRNKLADELDEKVPGAGDLLKKLPFFQ